MGPRLKLKEGDKVYIDCFSALGTGGPEIIREVLIRYDEVSGVPYKVYVTSTGQRFDDEGNAITAPTMYYISHKIKKNE